MIGSPKASKGCIDCSVTRARDTSHKGEPFEAFGTGILGDTSYTAEAFEERAAIMKLTAGYRGRMPNSFLKSSIVAGVC